MFGILRETPYQTNLPATSPLPFPPFHFGIIHSKLMLGYATYHFALTATMLNTPTFTFCVTALTLQSSPFVTSIKLMIGPCIYSRHTFNMGYPLL